VAARPAPGRAAAAAAAGRLRRRIAAALGSGAPLTTASLALDGRALMALLGCPPGPQVGEGLRHLLDLTLDEPDLNTSAGLARAARAWWAGRAGAAT